MGLGEWSWGSACAALLDRWFGPCRMPVVGRVLCGCAPGLFTGPGARNGMSSHEACAVWGARENMNTFEVGEGVGYVGPKLNTKIPVR